MEVRVNRAVCLRSGQCTYMHPKVFKEGEDGYPVVLASLVPEELEDEARDAADICPASAIVVEE
jgi:ferredoxin